VDPITLFALANGAVSAVKAGCKLYKDIKGAAGEVKEVLKDLDDQFQKLHPPEKPPTVAQKNAYIEEKNRVIDLNKKQGETTGIYTEIGNHLGAYYDNFHKCMAIFAEEEKRSKTEVYTGDDSLGKRALQRVLMMKVLGKEQKILIAIQMQKEAIQEKRRAARMKHLRDEFIIGVMVVIIIFVVGAMMMYVAYDRQQKYPQYGDGLFPKSEKQRHRDAEPQVYIGR
jgi:hypothetical protein